LKLVETSGYVLLKSSLCSLQLPPVAEEFAEKLGFRCPAPKGASDFEEAMP